MLSELANRISVDFLTAGNTFVSDRNRYAGGPRPIHRQLIYDSKRLGEYAGITDDELSSLSQELSGVFRNFHPNLPLNVDDSEIDHALQMELTELRKDCALILEGKRSVLINDFGLTIV